MYSFFVLIFEHRKTVPYAPLPINENKDSFLPDVGHYGFNYCFSWIISELTFNTYVETGQTGELEWFGLCLHWLTAVQN